MEAVVFYLFGAMIVGAGIGVITARNPVHAAMFLVLAFVSCAFLWMLLEAEFLAIVLVLVYVGAVMVLFLFVVMMLDINLSKLREGVTRFWWLGAVVALVVVAEILGRVGFSGWWSLLAVVPLLNVILLWVFAFTDWPNLPKRAN